VSTATFDGNATSSDAEAPRPSDAAVRRSRHGLACGRGMDQWRMALVFDIRTLLFAGSVAGCMCAGMVWLFRRLHTPSRDDLVWTAASQLTLGTAMMLIALRGVVPDWMSFQLANTMGTGAAALAYEGVRRIVDRRPMPWLAVATVVTLGGLYVWLGAGPDAFDARLTINSAVHAGFALAAVPLLLERRRSGEDAADPLRWALTFFGIAAALHVLRIAQTTVSELRISMTGQAEGPLQIVLPTLFVMSPLVYALILIGLVNGRLSAELWRLATIDTLTGVKVRRSFIDEARAALQPGREPVLMMLDLDRFKQVNDRFGHASGDRVLVRFAALLRDTFPDDAVIGRYGGEEFCVLLPDVPTGLGAVFAQRLCDATRATVFGLVGQDMTVTVSVGVAGPADGVTLEELLLAADRRLYLAKSGGRDRVVLQDHPQTPSPDRSVAAHPAAPPIVTPVTTSRAPSLVPARVAAPEPRPKVLPPPSLSA
jgi:diguanylate cyclase (GGDEF)-like protein